MKKTTLILTCILNAIYIIHANAQTYIVKPSYGVKYVLEPTLTYPNTTNRGLLQSGSGFWIATNCSKPAYDFSYAGTCYVDAAGSISNQSYNLTDKCLKNYLLPISWLKTDPVFLNNTTTNSFQVHSLSAPSTIPITSLRPIDIDMKSFVMFDAVSQPDGKLIVVGSGINTSGLSCMFICRFNISGTLDNTFFSKGYRQIAFGTDCTCRAVRLQSDGKIIYAAHEIAPNPRCIVGSLNTDGTNNAGGFGSSSGYTAFRYKYKGIDFVDANEIYAMYIDSKNNIFVGGAGRNAALLGGKIVPCYAKLDKFGNVFSGHHADFDIEGAVYAIDKIDADENLLVGGVSIQAGDKGLFLQKIRNFDNAADTSFHFKSGSVEGYYNLTPQDDIIYNLSGYNFSGTPFLIGESNGKGFYTSLATKPTSIDNTVKMHQQHLFPNPANNYINISNTEVACVSILDVVGKEMLHLEIAANQDIDISGLNEGIYYIKNLNNNTLQKFVKL